MWKKEVARDILALGSIPFYLIVIVRSVVGQYAPFTYQLIFALLFVFVFRCLTKFDSHVARGCIMLIFVSAFYGSFLFSFFAGLLFVAMMFSAYYLNRSYLDVSAGVVLGAISAGAAYVLSLLFV